VITFVTGIMFWFFFTRPWDKREEEMNMLTESSYRGNRAVDYDEEKLRDDDASQHAAPAQQVPGQLK